MVENGFLAKIPQRIYLLMSYPMRKKKIAEDEEFRNKHVSILLLTVADF